jgi:hypothetical protein
VVPKANVDRLAEAMDDAIDRPRRTHPATAGILATRFSPAAVEGAYWALYGQVAGTEGPTFRSARHRPV